MSCAEAPCPDSSWNYHRSENKKSLAEDKKMDEDERSKELRAVGTTLDHDKNLVQMIGLGLLSDCMVQQETMD